MSLHAEVARGVLSRWAEDPDPDRLAQEMDTCGLLLCRWVLELDRLLKAERGAREECEVELLQLRESVNG